MSGNAQNGKAPRTYAAVLGALLLLTVVTVAAAGVNFGSPFVNVVIALVIASAKASLVALYFMHLLHDKPINAVIFLVGVAMLGIFLMLTFLDTVSRETVESAGAAYWRGAPDWISARILRAS
ncbi:MAG: cytochrome C oxidase subunit IV family protein [Bryobacterales bacterium]|nr:cytochrome C oxidase subunit IV family protein [Bryobacterales bacterium]